MVVLAAIPSASVALIVTRSATLGIKNGILVACGIVLGDLIFVALAILGMSFLAETMGSFFVIFRYVGGAYLVWLGFSLIRSNEKVNLIQSDASKLSKRTIAWTSDKADGDPPTTVLAIETHSDDQSSWKDTTLQGGKVIAVSRGVAVKTK